MSALTKARKTQHYGVDGVEVFPWSIEVPLKAGAKVTVGGFIAIDSSGYGVDPTAVPGLVAIGKVMPFEGFPVQYDNTSGANGDIIVRVSLGIYEWDIGTAGDALTQANAYAPVYMIDDHTVGLTDGGATPRSLAGIFMGLNEASTQARVMTIGFLNALALSAARIGSEALKVTTIAAAGAIDPTSDIVIATITGTTAYTLANGTKIGQRIRIVAASASSGTPNATITPATPVQFATVSAIGAVGDFVELIWTATGWLPQASNGVTWA
jgi:hypothetical protein